MNKNNFKSIYKKELIDFFEYKKRCGFYHERDLYTLLNFDKYLFNNNIHNKKFNKDLVIDWINNINNLKESTKESYFSMLRQFSIYLYNNNYDSQIIYNNYYRRDKSFIPYIFTKEEIKIFLNTSKIYYKDKIKNDCIFNIFYLLYSTGIRISECLNITIKDIDFNNKTILLSNTKNEKDRQISFKEKLYNELYEYNLKYNYDKNSDDFYFTKPYTKNKYSQKDIYVIFRKVLFKSRIMRTKTGPRLHDLRHTFAVHNLIEAQNKKEDIYSFLPNLMSYMGHQNISSTEKYLRLVQDAYQDIRKTNNVIFNDIVKDKFEYEE